MSVDTRLAELTQGDGVIWEAMRYALLGKGKRLRPKLVIAAAKTFGAGEDKSLDPACAIEMVHAYSLVHDDLPCMDDDDLRRGRATLHRVYPEAVALLAGDALLTHAFLTISNARNLGPKEIVKLNRCLASYAGANGMVGGQTMDILSANEIYSKERLIEMSARKTGALFSASLEFGAIVANAHEYEAPMRQLGLQIGLAYQIIDDLEDAKQSSDQGKPTFLTLLSTVEANDLLNKTINEMERQLDLLPKGAPLIKDLVLLLSHVSR
jgi:geranylgeranyl diphosphate synthase type II